MLRRLEQRGLTEVGRHRRRRLGVAIAAIVGLSACVGLMAQTSPNDVEMSRISGDPAKPGRHFRLRSPAALDDHRAEDIYDIVRGALAAGYARSGHTAPRIYQTWHRFNRVPYLSSTHGNHYLNNYGNALARDYEKGPAGTPLPKGAVLAKDSFSMTQTGAIVLGPLFTMEKMDRGFSPVTGDWKFGLVLPDGTVMGETNGPGAKRVEYCIGCHLAREEDDHLYFVPENVRAARSRPTE